MANDAPSLPAYPLDVQTLTHWTADFLTTAAVLMRVDPVDALTLADESEPPLLTTTEVVLLATKRLCTWSGIDIDEVLRLARYRYEWDADDPVR